MRQVMDHASKDHGLKQEDFTTELVEKIKNLIVNDQFS
jgi:predicted small metal-binding protein